MAESGNIMREFAALRAKKKKKLFKKQKTPNIVKEQKALGQ